MADHDPIKITLSKQSAIDKLAELTEIDTAGWTVKADGLRFETIGGGAHVHLDLYTVISAEELSEIILASGLVHERAATDG